MQSPSARDCMNTWLDFCDIEIYLNVMLDFSFVFQLDSVYIFTLKSPPEKKKVYLLCKM